MPEEVKRKLKQQAEKKGLEKGSEAYNRYVYGTLQKIEENS